MSLRTVVRPTMAFLPTTPLSLTRTTFTSFTTPLHLRRPLIFTATFVMTTTPKTTTNTATTPTTQQSPSVTDDTTPMHLPDPLPNPKTLSTLQHTMTYTPTPPFRRFFSAFRMLRQLRGRLSNNTVLTIRLSGSLSEKPPPPPLPFSPPPDLTLPVLLRALRLAAHDPRIAHLHIRLDPLNVGWAKIFEIRRHLEYFRSAGKPISVFIETGGPKEFFLAMGYALYVAPEGALGLRGFMSSGSFIGGVLDKIGVAPQVERIGKYKSAGDQLMRKDMSDAQREVISALLADISSVWMESVTQATGISSEQLAEFVDRSPWDMREYVKAGLITDVCYESDLENALKLKYSKPSAFTTEQDVLKRSLQKVDVTKYIRRTNEKLLGIAGRKRIAVIRLVGAITGGKNGSSPITGQTAGSDTLLEIIQRVRDDKKYVACLVRCDSPGGSALASDIIWSELRKLATKKPVLCSQSDIAASGGYYVSMASEIISEPLTLTGSVGVVTAKPSLGEFYKKIGYAKENISVGSRYAELLVDDRPFNEEELEYYREGAQQTYRKFVSKAAESRGKSYDEMNEVAQGRVWTGRQAKEKGLVDYLGGMSKAIEILKDKAGIKEDEYVQLEEMRIPSSLMERLGLGLGSQSRSATVTSLREPLALTEIDGQMSSISPITKFVLDAAVAPVLDSVSVLSQSPSQIVEIIMRTFLRGK